MPEIKVNLNGSGNLSVVFRTAQDAASSLDRAIQKLAQQDFAAREAEVARLTYEKLSETEKRLVLATANYEQALQRQAAAQEKASAATTSASKSMTGYMTDLNSAIQMGVGFANSIKQAAEQMNAMAKEGANVRQTAESFDYLVQKVGAAPDLLQQLRTAARGTVDDLTIMSATTTLLAGASGSFATKLANATPQLMEMAKAAQKLNPSLGDTAYLYESLTAGIKRSSPEVLDNLGLTVKIGTANEEYAASIGKTVDALTAEEQKIALLNEAMEAGEILIQQAGGSTDSYADKIARAEAASTNFTNANKAMVSLALEPMYTALGAVNQKTAESGTAWMRYIPILNAVEPVVQGIIVAFEKLFGLQGKPPEIPTVPGATPTREYGPPPPPKDVKAETEYNKAMRIQNSYLGANTTYMLEMTKAKEAAAVGAKAVTAAEKASTEATKKHTDAIKQQNKELVNSIDKTRDAYANAQDAFEKAYGSKAQASLDKYVKGGKKLEDGYAAIDKVNGTNILGQYKAEKAMDALSQQYASGKITAEEYAKGLEAQKPVWAELDEQLQKTKKGFEDALQAWQTFISNLGSADGQEFSVTVNVNTNYGGGVSPVPNETGQYDPHGFASGGSYTVPPGYDENWSVGSGYTASSGEVVTITPANQLPSAGAQSSGSNQGLGGNVYNSYITVNASVRSDRDLETLAYRLRELERQKG